MTDAENLQVAQYIAGLKLNHDAEMQKLRADCQLYFDAMTAQHNKDKADVKQVFDAKLLSETKARNIAQQAEAKMGQAVHEIWKLANTQSTTTPQQLAVYVRQIINHYCPDFDIPY